MQRQLHIGPGFQSPENPDAAGAVQQGQGQQQAGDELAGNAAAEGVGSALQPALTADGVLRGPGQGAAHPVHFLPQRREGAVGQPSGQPERGVHAEGAHHGQQKPQRRAAFPAVQPGLLRRRPDRRDGIAAFVGADVGAQGTEAFGGGVHVLVRFAAQDPGFLPGKGGADQQPVGLGFGGENGHRAGKAMGKDRHLHGHSPA